MKTISDLSVSQTFKSDISTRKCWNSYNIINRTEQSVKFQENLIKDNRNKPYLKPISDFPIIKNLENFQFPHPQLLISFLSMHRMSPKSQIRETLIPYFLIPDFSINNVIDAISDSLSLNSSHLIQNFTSNLNCQKAKEEWEKRFKEIPIDTNLKITGKWSLSTLDDLESLHLFACSVNCKIYLLFNLIFPNDKNENTIFSTIVGSTDDSSFCVYFLCESPTNLIYAKPMNFSKESNQFNNDLPIFKRLTLPMKKYSFYINFSKLLKEISLNGSLFNSISAHFIVDPSISEPVLSFSNSDQLKIEIKHPNDDYSYYELLEKLEHITPSFSTTEPAIMDDHSKYNFDCNENRKIKFHSNSLITIHSTHQKKIELNNIHKLTRISQIEQLASAFNSLNFPQITESSDMKLFRLIRFFFPFITKYKTFQTEKIETSPIITTHTNDFSLSESSKHPYAHFLCLHSIFNAAIKSQSISCKKCHKNRTDEERREVIMIPVRTVSDNCLSSPFVSWICIDCFKRLNHREKLTIKSQFPMFHEVVDIDNLTRIQSPHNMFIALKETEERIHMSIMSIRSQPIGALRALVPRIDNAYNELINIMKMFRQRMIRMKNITASDLATVRNSDEYKARLGSMERAVKVEEPDFEVVDYEMFELYLSGFTEKTAGTTEYLLTQPESDIKEKIIDEAVQKMQELCTTISAKIESIEMKYKKDDSMFNEEIEKGNLCFDIDVKCENENVQCNPDLLNVYDVHLAENGNFITSMPIIKITTRKYLKGLSFYKENQLITIVYNEETATTELYCIPLSNCNLDIHNDVSKPNLIIDGVGDCEVAFSGDGLSIAILGIGSDENPLYIVTYDDDEGSWRAENAGSFPATKIAWLNSDESTIFVADDDTFCVLKSGLDENDEEEETAIINIRKHRGVLVKLIPSSSTVWALFDSGECILLNPNDKSNEEEEEEASENNESKKKEEECNERIRFISDCKFVDGFMTSENGEIGITAVDEKGRLYFKPSPLTTLHPSVCVQPSFDHITYNFPSGVFDLSNSMKKTDFSATQIALSFVELFPVLVGYFYKSTFFLIRNDKDTFKSYHPQNKNNFLVHSIRSFYINEVKHVSLHHIEETLLQMIGIKAKIVTFIDFGLQNCSSFIDSIFGTSFAFCESDGVWIGIRTVNGFAYIIVFVKAFSNETKNKILFDASIASLICLNQNQRNIFFLAENEMTLFDTLTSINNHNILSSKLFNACAIIFSRNSKQKIFEFKAIEASLKNIVRNATIDSIHLELFDDYSELFINDADGTENDKNSQILKSFRTDWLKMLDDIHPADISDAIDNIKKMISMMATLYHFQDVDPSSVINNCFL